MFTGIKAKARAGHVSILSTEDLNKRLKGLLEIFWDVPSNKIIIITNVFVDLLKETGVSLCFIMGQILHKQVIYRGRVMKINTKLVVLTLVIHNLFTFVLPFIVSESSPSSEGQFSLNDTCNET